MVVGFVFFCPLGNLLPTIILIGQTPANVIDGATGCADRRDLAPPDWIMYTVCARPLACLSADYAPAA